MTKISDSLHDTLDKVSSPTSRAGYTVERVAKMSQNGVSHDVIALQMTNNSRQENVYTPAHVDAYVQLYQDAQSYVGITHGQAKTLIKDQRDQNGLDGLPA